MKISHSLAQLQKEHVVMELECIDRMYLNAYVPQLTSEAGIAAFCRGYLGHRFASTKQAVAMTKAFVRSIRSLYPAGGPGVGALSEGPAQRRRPATATACLQKGGRSGLCRRRPGEGPGASHHPQTPGGRGNHSVDHLFHRHGQRLLLLLPRPRTSARSSSSSAPTFLTRPSSASTATNT